MTQAQEVIPMNAVTPVPEQATALTPMTMIDRALALGASPESLKTLLDLQERWEANEARKLFVVEMAKAKQKFAPILKKNYGYNNRYKYETLGDIQDAVDAALAEHGFFYDWKTEDAPDGRVRVTCIVTHEAGHSRSNSLSGHPEDTADAKANMNGHQRMGGAVTYLQRYTLKAALGIAASADTDAGSREKIVAGTEPITADEFVFLRDLIEETGAVEEKVLASVNAKTMEGLTQKQYREAVSKLQTWAKKKVANGTTQQ